MQTSHPAMITTHHSIFLFTSSLLILSLDATCVPSACGAIRNISYPFRLTSDPNNCGNPRFELTCENNATLVYLNSHKYYVKSINYQSSTIMLIDASINNDTLCIPSSPPPSPSNSMDPYYNTKKAVTMTAARGTIGYVAPELISRSIGEVSYKADVYNFGMLMVEMVNLKRDLVGINDDPNQYFPNWIYECFNQSKEIEMLKAIEDDYDDDGIRSIALKMTIVALWCIRMNPNDRPSMSMVLEMLEGDVQRLRIPKYPSQSRHIVLNVDQTEISYSTSSISRLHYDASSSA